MNWFSVDSSGWLLYTIRFWEIREFLNLMKSEVHVIIVKNSVLTSERILSLVQRPIG